jgi:hypothetical protein
MSACVKARVTVEERPITTASLTHETLNEIRGRFFVPTYQRGYRWGKDEVRHLLEDIWASGGKPYSLQPIVVKLREDAASKSEKEWELIDGQQRLTTLYLILHYIQHELRHGMGAPYTLHYATRTDSTEFLATIHLSHQEDRRNIDYFHMHVAYGAIGDWFASHGDLYSRNRAAGKLHGYLFDSVRVIRYEAPADVAAIPLFTRLNIGRIPLTAAELVKAALLSGAGERTLEIASQWDAIERDLHEPDTWAFVAGLDGEDGDTQYPTRISLLLDALADGINAPERRRDRYHTFDTLLPSIRADGATFWSSVLAMHAQILGWHRQPGIYNKIGFLVATGMSLGRFTRLASGIRKSAFEEALDRHIRAHIKTSNEQLATLNYVYNRAKLMDILLLLNVQTATQAGQHFPFARHVGRRWSLEHIHAQNAEDLNRADQWKTWLESHQKALRALGKSPEMDALDAKIDAVIAEIAVGKGSGDTFKLLSEDILGLLNRDTDADHFIHNLALLSSAHNSSLNNSVFEVKRQMIMKLDSAGEYVPPCTRNVFLKYYTGADAQQPHFWSEPDKIAYTKAIRKQLQPYLTSTSEL